MFGVCWFPLLSPCCVSADVATSNMKANNNVQPSDFTTTSKKCDFSFPFLWQNSFTIISNAHWEFPSYDLYLKLKVFIWKYSIIVVITNDAVIINWSVTYLSVITHWIISPRSPPSCSWTRQWQLPTLPVGVKWAVTTCSGYLSLLFDFTRTSSAPLVSRKALMGYWNTHVEILKLDMRPVRMRVRNLVNVSLLSGWGKASAPSSLVSVSSCMTGIIRLVFLNEARCLSSLSSSPLLPTSPPHPQRRMEQPLTPLGLQMPGCVQLFVLSVLGRPVLHYKLIVLLSLNHSRRRQEEFYHTAIENFHVSFLYLLFIVSFTPSYSFSISNKPIRIQ